MIEKNKLYMVLLCILYLYRGKILKGLFFLLYFVECVSFIVLSIFDIMV